MKIYKLGEVEARFAEIIWANEPISSGELVNICKNKLEWKKSTTYTVLRKLCDKGIFKNEKGRVTSVYTKEVYYSMKSELFVDENFNGSLPSFIAAFTNRKSLSEREIAEIERIINSFKEG